MVIISLNNLPLCLLRDHFGGITWVLSAFWVQSHNAAVACNGWRHIHVLPRLCRSIPSFAPGVMLSMLLRTANKLFGFECLNFALGSLPWGRERSAAVREVAEMSSLLSEPGCWTSGAVFLSHALRSAEASLPCRQVDTGRGGLGSLGGRAMLSPGLGWRNRSRGASGAESSLALVPSKLLLSRVQPSAQAWWDAAGGDAGQPSFCVG